MGLIDLGVRYRGQAMDTMGAVARRETERVNFNRKLAAQEKAAKWNAAGQGVGLGYMGYQTGALGKAAETVGASPGVVDFLTPAKSGAETAAANAAQQGGNAIEATKVLNTPGLPSGYAPEPGSLSNVPMPAGSGATPAPAPAPAAGGSAATVGGGQAASAPTLGSMAEGVGAGTGTIGGAISGGSMGATVGTGIGTGAFGAGGAAGGAVGGAIGGGLGGAIGGTVAAPLSAIGSGLSAMGATTAGGALSGAAGAITGTAAAGGAAAGAGVGSALSSLGALILAF